MGGLLPQKQPILRFLQGILGFFRLWFLEAACLSLISTGNSLHSVHALLGNWEHRDGVTNQSNRSGIFRSGVRGNVSLPGTRRGHVGNSRSAPILWTESGYFPQPPGPDTRPLEQSQECFLEFNAAWKSCVRHCTMINDRECLVRIVFNLYLGVGNFL